MSAQSGESSSADLSSPFVSAFSIVCSVSENAVPSALSDAEIFVIALGTSGDAGHSLRGFLDLGGLGVERGRQRVERSS